MTMKIPTKLLTLIKENKDFLILSHVNPEGDAVGSSLALALGLRKMKKNVFILNKHSVPETLKFLPHSDLIKNRVPQKSFDVLFLVDCGTPERAGFSVSGGSGRDRKNINAKKIAVIDHHLTPKPNKEYINMIEPEASSAGELIYKLLKALNIPLDREIAMHLYTAIFTDTGGFRYSNTTPESLKASCELIRSGANPWEIAREIYENIPINHLILLTRALLTLEKNGNIASITITRRMMQDTKTTAQDTENFVDYPRKIKGIEVALLFREEGKNLFKISFRSKERINVADIARAFGGGGHARAAGCQLKGSLKEVKEKVFKAVRKALNIN